jgi:Domain of unknown function (DUF4148)
MKAISLLNRTVLATLLVSASVAAFAGGGGPRSSGPYLYSGTRAMAATAAHADASASAANTLSTDTSTAPGKTREQVRAELLQAEEAGLIPVHQSDYPPSAATVTNNRVRFQQIEQAWQANSTITAAEK